MPNREDLLKERLAQLDEISHRRNGLLREMYEMIRGSQDVGQILSGEHGPQDVGLTEFLNRFDLKNSPENASISSLPKSFFQLPPLEVPEASASQLEDQSQSPLRSPSIQADESQPSPRRGLSRPKSRSIPPMSLEYSEQAETNESPPIEQPSPPVAEIVSAESSELPSIVEHAEGDRIPKDEDEEVVPPTPTPEVYDSRHVTPQNAPTLMAYQDSPEERGQELPPEENIGLLGATDAPSSSEEPEPHSPRTPSPLPSVLMNMSSAHASSSRPTIKAPSPVYDVPFNFDDELLLEQSQNAKPEEPSSYFNPHYTMPPLNVLPPEFQRKKPSRQQRKRDKDKDRVESKKEDWIPLGMNKWRALLRANPAWKHVAKSSKSLTTKDWNVALTELRLIRTFDRIEMLKDNGRWSFRQPKKQRGVGGLVKTHWDYLLDEMKWMRIDFREERKWKTALAYTLAVAVQEWHAAGSVEERVRLGICVIWPKTRHDDLSASGVVAEETEDAMDVDEEPVSARPDSVPMGDYGSDDGSDDDQDKDPGEIIDSLDANSLVHGALAPNLEPKIEDVDDLSAVLQLSGSNSQEPPQTNVESGHNVPRTESQDETNLAQSALKATSHNPVLPSASHRAALAALTNNLRQKIAYTETSRLFLDLDDFEVEKPIVDTNLPHSTPEVHHHFPELSALFPDLQTYGLPEVVPAVIQLDNKKNNRRERDDPNKRSEDTTYTKLTPVSKLMYCRPTLLGPLQPSRHWNNGTWSNLDDCAITPSEGSKPNEQVICALFERIAPPNPQSVKPPMPLEPKRIPEPRVSEQLWTASDDALLKSLVETYHNNWALIADAFNTSRLSVSTDRRTSWDCFYRWTLPPTVKTDGESPAPSVTNLSNRPKRHAAMSASEAAAVASANSNPEARKRRRHVVMQEAIRKVGKKREQLAKAAANQKKQAVVHDTHGQYNKMPKLTPQELGRMKVEKDYQEHLARQRNDELRNKAMREQQARMQQGTQNGQANGVPRPVAPGFQAPPQALPPIRAQVNISQQQRISNPMVAAGNARLSPQHQQAMQAQVRAMQAAQQAQAQAQVQALAQGQPQSNSHLSPTLSYTNRSSSSPSISQESPVPHAQSVADTPVTNGNGTGNGTPRPPSTQPAHPGHAQMPANVTRAAMPYYANMNMVGGQQFTQEQLDQALRLQSILNAQQRGSQISPGAQQGQQMSPPPVQSQAVPAPGPGGYTTQ